jgi:hypothetical protein
MLPNSNSQVSCKARVAWTNDPEALKKPSLPPGMGIQFLSMSLENVQLIRSFLNEYELKPVW